MEKESTALVLSPLLLIGGLVILIYGVSLDDGLRLNTVMIVGGLVMVVATGLLSGALMVLEGEGEGEGEE